MRLVASQPKDKMARLWSLHDLALIPLRDQPLFTTVIPSKMFEAMGMGIPILMSVPEGEATGLVRETGAGVLVPPEDPQAMADMIVRLAGDAPALAAYRAAGLVAASRFTRDRQAALMLETLERVAAVRRPAVLNPPKPF